MSFPLDPTVNSSTEEAIRDALSSAGRTRRAFTPELLAGAKYEPLLNAPAVLKQVGTTASAAERAEACIQLVRRIVGGLDNRSSAIAQAVLGLDAFGDMTVPVRQSLLLKKHKLSQGQYEADRPQLISWIAAGLCRADAQAPAFEQLRKQVTGYEQAVFDLVHISIVGTWSDRNHHFRGPRNSPLFLRAWGEAYMEVIAWGETLVMTRELPLDLSAAQLMKDVGALHEALVELGPFVRRAARELLVRLLYEEIDPVERHSTFTKAWDHWAEYCGLQRVGERKETLTNLAHEGCRGLCRLGAVTLDDSMCEGWEVNPTLMFQGTPHLQHRGPVGALLQLLSNEKYDLPQVFAIRDYIVEFTVEFTAGS